MSLTYNSRTGLGGSKEVYLRQESQNVIDHVNRDLSGYGSAAINGISDPFEPSVPDKFDAKYLTRLVGASLVAYDTVVSLIDTKIKHLNIDTSISEAEFKNEFEHWARPSKFSYVSTILKLNPGLQATLVATPNIPLPAKQLVQIERENDKCRAYSTKIESDILQKYTPTELSGSDSEDKKIRFSFWFDAPHIKDGNVSKQQDTIMLLQKEYPFLRPPSVLETSMYIKTLQIAGKLGNLASNRFYTRYPQLRPVLVDGWECVPGSFLQNGQERCLTNSSVHAANDVYLVVG